jgi:hypothetical protein
MRLLLLITSILLFLVLPLGAESAPDHIVSVPVLRQAVRSAAQARQENLAKLDRFFASRPATKALDTVKLDRAKVSSALNLLSDDELARLAARSTKIQKDITAGALSNQEITYILIALATAVIILVIVEAK